VSYLFIAMFGLITIIGEGHLSNVTMSISMLLLGMLRGEANLARFARLIGKASGFRTRVTAAELC
jgi:hypothetical protein